MYTIALDNANSVSPCFTCPINEMNKVMNKFEKLLLLTLTLTLTLTPMDVELSLRKRGLKLALCRNLYAL